MLHSHFFGQTNENDNTLSSRTGRWSRGSFHIPNLSSCQLSNRAEQKKLEKSSFYFLSWWDLVDDKRKSTRFPDFDPLPIQWSARAVDRSHLLEPLLLLFDWHFLSTASYRERHTKKWKERVKSWIVIRLEWGSWNILLLDKIKYTWAIERWPLLIDKS